MIRVWDYRNLVHDDMGLGRGGRSDEQKVARAEREAMFAPIGGLQLHQ